MADIKATTNEFIIRATDGTEIKLPIERDEYDLRPDHPKHHRYPTDGERIRSEIGFKSLSDWQKKHGPYAGTYFNMGPTTRENAFMALRHVPAPETFSKFSAPIGSAVKHKSVSKLPALGSVTHYVYPEHNIVVNVTNPGHLLHPGIVVRELQEEDGIFYVETTGVGTGDYGWLNEKLAPWLWEDTTAPYGGVDNRLKAFLSKYGTNPIPETVEDKKK